MSDAHTESLRSPIEAIYRQLLSALDQTLVQLFSVIYEPVNRTKFLACVNELDQKDEKGSIFVSRTLKIYVDKLLQRELLIQDATSALFCNPLIAEIATRDAVREGTFERFVEVIDQILPIPTGWDKKIHQFKNTKQFFRAARVGIYRQDLAFIEKQFEDFYRYNYQNRQITLDTVFKEVCNNPFDAEWYADLCPELFEPGLSSILVNSQRELTPSDDAFTLLHAEITVFQRSSEPLRFLLIEQLLLRGNIDLAETIVVNSSTEYPTSMDTFRGWIALVRGDYPAAIAFFESALAAIKKASKKRKIYFGTLGGIFYILALLKDGSAQSLHDASGYVAIAKEANYWLSPVYQLFEPLVQWQQGNISQQKELAQWCEKSRNQHHKIYEFFRLLCFYWVDGDSKKLTFTDLTSFYDQAQAAGYQWLAMEVAELIGRKQTKPTYRDLAKAWQDERKLVSIVEIIRPQSAWELSLTALTHLVQKPEEVAKIESQKRLAWFITFRSSENYEIQPKEQIINTKGVWTQGRPISLKRLAQKPGEFDYLTAQDLKVCSHLDAYYSYGYYGKTEYSFDENAIAELIAHPLVFWEDNPQIRVDIVKGEPELLVKKTDNDRLALSLSPSLNPDAEILVSKESPTRLKVITILEEHQRIASIIGDGNRLEVPLIAQERVLAAINAVSRLVTVHSDIGGGLENALEVPAQSQPHVHLLPAGSGLQVTLLTRPFAEGGPYFVPGKGGATVITEINGQRYQTTRSLSEEQQLAQSVVEASPTLKRSPSDNNEWFLEEPENCLELLLELQTLGDAVIIEWPEGEKFRVSHQGSASQLSLHIERQRDWFAADGELRLDDNLVLGLQQLLNLLQNTPGRFVQLADGQFLALTKEFRQRLEELRSFSEKQGDSRRFHPLAALALENIFDEAGEIDADQHWKSHIKRLKEMKTLDPQLPSTFQAELRDYQLEGFQWLARLAHWGVGACLADDMGLGKTVQALALILTRASEGPTLIVAPTSVCPNWISEAARFAPTLNATQFGSGDRKKALDNLQPLDLVLCTYGLLQQDDVAEMIAKVNWRTIVLDEAQAIKNMATKRSQAAMGLKADFKLITTGTPIENHLGELWNLFRFINPGLLGSLESFNERFAVPIERYQSKPARQQLKKLIQPFLLRRTKNQVLDELPSRTEILLQVELSTEEMAFYEALRRQAIAKLETTDANPGTKHLQVLAEIMRLRRACCNPSLVLPDTPLPSAKLELFGEVLQELIENRHKALVFSQFVDHLHILRDYLDKKQIKYQYLDGSTPINERKKRVDAFQSGEGDVFLISLKAGGTGLNLTAADYVIHMDPWWNPAVEDQASDRAHRIGQQRPVTIYRLVAKNTIEEKIVDLHRQKRDLADSLLEGTEISGKISTDQLLQLISS